jgi:S-adenosylmethionine:tRNA ribosyltransferase-isomerase
VTATFVLPTELEASEPAEVRGQGRDDVRLLVGHRRRDEIEHRQFRDLPALLRRGDVLVVNSSATLPAAVDADLDGARVVVHFSSPIPDGTWTVELRSPEPGGATRPYAGGRAGARVALPGGATLTLLAPYSPDRLWLVRAAFPVRMDVPAYLAIFGRPIRYSYVHVDWPLSVYRTIFGTQPGSAEMPSAGRPFTAAILERLRFAGVRIVPVLLHAGVASPEAHEKPSPERYEVSPRTAELVQQAREAGDRIIAVGTTVVRALESSTDRDGRLRAARGWTDLVVTPERGVRVVDGLLTGFHEPQASHLQMLEAIAGAPLLDRCYDAAVRGGYLFHEFGDVNLLLP